MEFKPESFDPWAENYDNDVTAEAGFPFSGYSKLLQSMQDLARPKLGEKLMDLGCGTGNLGAAFLKQGCQIWATDFSPRMIENAKINFPEIQFAVVDVRDPIPTEFPQKFDIIVSSYVLHHFPIEEKIKQITHFSKEHLHSGGRILIGDLMFASHAVMQSVADQYADTWDDEFYWILDRDQALMEKAGLFPHYQQISFCAGLLGFGL